MKLTRRQLVVGAAAGSVAANAMAQSSGAAAGGALYAPSVADFAKDARESVQRNGETLAKFVIPMSTEPAFQFKA
jgi:hypothetical protein